MQAPLPPAHQTPSHQAPCLQQDRASAPEGDRLLYDTLAALFPFCLSLESLLDRFQEVPR